MKNINRKLVRENVPVTYRF
jgi:hypothetical protein